MPKNKPNKLDKMSQKLTTYIGTSTSLLVHSIAFIGIFSLRFFNVPTEEVLLILTTVLSIEAIYLAIFIQMSVNRTTESLAQVEVDIDDIQEDVGGIQEDVDDIQEDVDSLETNIKEISEDYLEDEIQEADLSKVLKDIRDRLKGLQKDIDSLQKHKS